MGVAALVVVIGAVIYLLQHGLQPADYRVFHGTPAELRRIGGIVQSAVALRGRGTIQLGLLLLIATPIARVMFSIFGFAEERDRMYMAFTAVVLVILLFSLVGIS